MENKLELIYTIIQTAPHAEDTLTTNVDLTEAISIDNKLDIFYIKKRLDLMSNVVMRKLKKLFYSGMPERQIQDLTEYLIGNFPKQVKKHNISNDTAIDLTMTIFDELIKTKAK